MHRGGLSQEMHRGGLSSTDASGRPKPRGASGRPKPRDASGRPKPGGASGRPKPIDASGRPKPRDAPQRTRVSITGVEVCQRGLGFLSSPCWVVICEKGLLVRSMGRARLLDLLGRSDFEMRASLLPKL